MKYDVKCNVLMTSKPHFDQVCDPHVIKYIICDQGNDCSKSVVYFKYCFYHISTVTCLEQ